MKKSHKIFIKTYSYYDMIFISFYIRYIYQYKKVSKTVGKSTDLQNNKLLSLFIKGGEISIPALKKIYRKLCLSLHPDVIEDEENNEGIKFIELNKQYEEILTSFPELRSQLDNVRTNIQYSESGNVKKDFYFILNRYTALGLHSPRVRLREQLKKRNTKIVNQILQVSRLYSPDFIPCFNKFNSIVFHSFSSQRIERMHKKLKEKLLLGIFNAVDYIENEIESSKRTALSYFKDIRYMPIPESDYGTAVYELADWFYKDLEN